MRHFVLLLFACILCCSSISAQFVLSGKVVDALGEPVVGALVRSESDNSKVAMTDFDGNYQLSFTSTGVYRIHVYLMGFDEIIDDLDFKTEKSIVRDYVLQEKGFTSGEVVIESKANKAADSYMEKMKQNSAVTFDYISSELMKKTGDQNVVNAIARVSGVSTSGGLITVRGIGDRYVRTTLNGARIPTLDPLTNNIKLDIFPSALVDNIVITKTTASDLPGDWAGAYISVETKDFPDKLLVAIESQFGYNIQSTGKDFITSERSSGDWLAFDSGLRTRESNTLKAPNLNPGQYAELSALGLQGYYAGLGVHGWVDGSAQSELYFKLGLVQLGLLNASNMNNQSAYNAARSQYNQIYRPKAFELINPSGTDYNNGFSNGWNTRFIKAPINFSQNFTIGNQTELLGKQFGYIVGFRYGTSYRYDPNGISQRVGDASLNYPFDRQDYAQISRETNSWSALVNLAYKLNDNNKMSLMFMPNVIGTNDVANYVTIPLEQEYQDIDVSKLIFYEQRKQLIYQGSSSHFIPSRQIRIENNISYTDGYSVAPDFKANQYMYVTRFDSIQSYQFSPTAGEGIRRYFRYLDENILDVKSTVEFPYTFKEKVLVAKVKTGLAFTRNYRKTDNDEYRVNLGNNPFLVPLANDDLDSYLSAPHFTMNNGVIDYYYSQFNFDRNHSFGYNNVLATFLQTNFDVRERLRLLGGLRLEHTDLFTDVDKYFSEGYERNDPRRENVGGFPNVNAASINQWDLLPNVSVIYRSEAANANRSNVRLNFSQSIARPSIRELSDAAIFDNEFRTLIYGNSDLKVVRVSNYDFRYEKFFQSGDNVSASVFYKDFRNHIEMGFGSSGITWENIDRSNVVGVEFEGRKGIGEHLELRANVTLVRSRAQFIRKDFQVIDGLKEFTIIDTTFRPMFGQAPYLVNFICNYDLEESGLNVALSYNVQGPRLVIAGAVKGRPDVYELPRNLLDLKVSKKYGDHFSFSLTVRDIFNAPVRRSYDLPTGWVDYDSFRFGTVFQLGITYKL